jgi:hypothetical protein
MSLLYIAECAAVSGRGYYATGPGLDVPGRLLGSEAVLVCPTGTPRARIMRMLSQVAWVPAVTKSHLAHLFPLVDRRTTSCDG